MVLALLLASALAADDGRQVRGMTVSTPTWGWEWGTDEMASTLDELDAMGVNWVAIHPYARISGDGTVQDRLDPAHPPEWLERPIAEAHARGMRVFVVPHLAYWGSPFSWRGAIQFADDDAWARFFTTYRAWIVDVARITAAADGFSVGSELDATLAHEAEWRAIVADVREVHSGRLTYAANWTDYQRVPFWDALDAVGVQAYFPLAQGAAPEPAALDAGWARIMGDMRAVASRTGKPIVFTELGYARSTAAAAEPWAHVDDPRGEALQTACLRAALRAIEAEPAVVGAFLWKWFPGERLPDDFAMARPAARAVIREAWAD